MIQPKPKPQVDILAVDPGNHCGLAWRYADGTWDTTMIYENFSKVASHLTPNPPRLLTIENFNTAGNISKYGLYTVRLIGQLQGIAWLLDIPVVMHDPQHRLPYIPTARGLLNVREQATKPRRRWVVHEMDALAHLIYQEDFSYAHHTNSTTTGSHLHATGERSQTPNQALRTYLGH